MQNQEKLNQAISSFENWRQTRTSKHVNIPDELRGVFQGSCRLGA